MFVPVCVRARARRVHICTSHAPTHSFSHIRVCVSLSRLQSLFQFGVLCAPGSPLNCRWRSSIERTRVLQRLAAVIAQRGIAVAIAHRVLRPWHLVPLGTLVKRQAPWVNGVTDSILLFLLFYILLFFL